MGKSVGHFLGKDWTYDDGKYNKAIRLDEAELRRKVNQLGWTQKLTKSQMAVIVAASETKGGGWS